MEVGRQCSNLAPDFLMLTLVHPKIRLRALPKPDNSAVSGKKKPATVPRLTDAMMREAARRYEAKETLKVIARDLGVSRQRLASRLRSHGVKIRREAPSAEQVGEMRRRYQQGESPATVGAKVGFDAGTVRNHLLAAGVSLRDSHGR